MAATLRDLEDDRGVYVSCVLERRIKLHPRLQNKHYMESISNILRNMVEGICGPDGYVRPHSVQILHVSPGVVEMSSLAGTAAYTVRFMADVCNPAVGDILTCRVENVNNFGVLAVNMSETRVLEVVLPREPISFEHAEKLDGLEPGSTLRLEVMARSYKLGQRTITMVGKVVGAGEEGPPSRVKHQVREESEEDEESDDLGESVAPDDESDGSDIEHDEEDDVEPDEVDPDVEDAQDDDEAAVEAEVDVDIEDEDMEDDDVDEDDVDEDDESEADE